jgi:hypothetical protein
MDELLVILLPVYEDWQAVSLLIPRIADQLSGQGYRLGVLIVDDGSRIKPALTVGNDSLQRLSWLRLLTLRRNLGHQRAIAVGLSYIDEHIPCEAVIVMDADGEDRAEDIPLLIDRYRQEQRIPIVFAERQRRVESWSFRAFYLLYRLIHRLLTGRGIRNGSFSIIPRERLESLVVVSELWIHYAASAVRSRQPMSMVPSSRGPRLAGESRMNFTSLVVHGLSAISVYSDTVFTRLITASACLAALALAGMTAVVGIRMFSAVAIPGWASYVLGVLLIVLLQAVTFVASLTFMILGSRQQAAIVPRRDYVHYIAGVRDVVNHDAVTS